MILPGQAPLVCHLVCSSPPYLRQCLSVYLELTDQLDYLTSWPAGLRDPPVSAFRSQAMGLYTLACLNCTLVLGIQTYVLRLCIKHFTNPFSYKNTVVECFVHLFIEVGWAHLQTYWF